MINKQLTSIITYNINKNNLISNNMVTTISNKKDNGHINIFDINKVMEVINLLIMLMLLKT